MHLMPGADNEACLKWLDSALEQAFERRESRLHAYLEVVLEEVLFEAESQGSDRVRA